MINYKVINILGLICMFLSFSMIPSTFWCIYYNEYLDEGLTPSESERLARLKLSEIDEDLLDIPAFLKRQANK